MSGIKKAVAVLVIVAGCCSALTAQTKENVDLIVRGGAIVTMLGPSFMTAALRCVATRLWLLGRGLMSRGDIRARRQSMLAGDWCCRDSSMGTHMSR